MSFDPMSAGLAVRLTHSHVTSARPDAPVVPETPSRARLAGLRARLADDLVAVARWVEPAEPRRGPSAGACQPG
jgi:hypothetical protein